MRRLILIFITCVVCQFGSYAQNDSSDVSFSLGGLITDAQTGEPVPFATVRVADSPVWVVSDQNGAYSINLPAGPVKLQFSAIGYKTPIVEVNLDHDSGLNVSMELDAFVDYHLKRWEIDWKAFNCYGFSNMYDGAMTMFGLEGRYDIWRTPLEAGLGFSYAMPLNLKQQEYRYWTVYASVDCKLLLLEFLIGKNWTMPYIGVAAGGGQSYSADARNIANFSLRAGFYMNRFRLFFEQHFNTDNARGSYWGLTYYF